MNNLAVIFDMDGVLVNSHPHNAYAIGSVLKEYDLDFQSVKKLYGEKWRGSSFKQLLAWLSNQYNISIDITEFTFKVDVALFELMGSGEKLVDANLHSLLTELKHNEVKLGVASSSQRSRIEKTLELIHIDTFFDSILGAEDVPNHKPSPDVYLKIAEQLAVLPVNCLVIEDTIDGVTSAKSAGAKVIAYTGFHEIKHKIEDADLHIEDFANINYTLIKRIVQNKRSSYE